MTQKPLKSPEELAAQSVFSVARYEQARSAKHDMIRELVLEHKRVDVLCEYVLGGEPPMWFHRDLPAPLRSYSLLPMTPGPSLFLSQWVKQGSESRYGSSSGKQRLC